VRVLVHSLAFGSLKPFLADPMKDAVTAAQMDMTLDVMAHSLVYWTQEVVGRGLMREGGRIYAMTSSGSTRVLPSYGPVSAAKAALEAHVRQLAAELAPRGITVNAIRAGVTATPAAQKIPAYERLEAHARLNNPSGRMDHARGHRARRGRALAPRHAVDHRQRDRRGRRRGHRRMSYVQAIVLGLVQGITEFLPISSSGHLILVPHVFGWPDQGQAFDTVIHIGTFAALVAYFRVELVKLMTGALSTTSGRDPHRRDDPRRDLWPAVRQDDRGESSLAIVDRGDHRDLGHRDVVRGSPGARATQKHTATPWNRWAGLAASRWASRKRWRSSLAPHAPASRSPPASSPVSTAPPPRASRSCWESRSRPPPEATSSCT
jgi:NAD(P)-dependent dehydrogenase (short-subunit alcohol dehydrogenase family)